MRTPVWITLLLIGATLGAGYMGAVFPPGAWYTALAKPSWTPPGAVIGPVWAVLFVLMIIAVWRVGRAPRGRGTDLALAAYGGQIVLNAAWSWLFFGRNDLAATTVLVVVLLATAGFALLRFWRVDRLAGLLLAPYVLWVGFDLFWLATLLRLNP